MCSPRTFWFFNDGSYWGRCLLPSGDPWPAFSMVPRSPLLQPLPHFSSHFHCTPGFVSPAKIMPPVHLAPTTRLLRADGENYKSCLKVPPRNGCFLNWFSLSLHSLFIHRMDFILPPLFPASSIPILAPLQMSLPLPTWKTLVEHVSGQAVISNMFIYFLKRGLWDTCTRFTWGVS